MGNPMSSAHSRASRVNVLRRPWPAAPRRMVTVSSSPIGIMIPNMRRGRSRRIRAAPGVSWVGIQRILSGGTSGMSPESCSEAPVLAPGEEGELPDEESDDPPEQQDHGPIKGRGRRRVVEVPRPPREAPVAVGGPALPILGDRPSVEEKVAVLGIVDESRPERPGGTGGGGRDPGPRRVGPRVGKVVSGVVAPEEHEVVRGGIHREHRRGTGGGLWAGRGGHVGPVAVEEAPRAGNGRTVRGPTEQDDRSGRERGHYRLGPGGGSGRADGGGEVGPVVVEELPRVVEVERGRARSRFPTKQKHVPGRGVPRHSAFAAARRCGAGRGRDVVPLSAREGPRVREGRVTAGGLTPAKEHHLLIDRVVDHARAPSGGRKGRLGIRQVRPGPVHVRQGVTGRFQGGVLSSEREEIPVGLVVDQTHSLEEGWVLTQRAPGHVRFQFGRRRPRPAHGGGDV